MLSIRSECCSFVSSQKYIKICHGATLFKLNTDGCSKGSPGSAGGGGILRDDSGFPIMAYSDYYGDYTNNVAESNAILQEMQWCITNGYKNVDIESDSMIIINMINDHSNVNCHIVYLIGQINSLKRNGNYKFQHCYREVNNLADYLANMGEKGRKYTFFTQNSNIPNELKNWLKNDIEGTPNFRICPKRKSFTFDNG
ncbi:hypothetical protein R3W88_012122 [Solanum pinnatisectum]|uniref:RNase H type-1 domain-containing protein n=1 Tax=Solanum pinnatisectum TaxID=50273 RepID=A0AAV9L937_9SOLN|nr:hypothetical protein R3W88_012122 [Solanum pinnatisectum]